MSFPTSPVDGQVYNEYKYDGTNGLWKVNSASGILQTLSVTSDTKYTVTTLNFKTDVAVTITPKSVNSKILIMGNASISNTASNHSGGAGITRDNTILSQGSGSGSSSSKNHSMLSTGGNDNYDISTIPIHFLDTPSTTDPITYYLTVSTRPGYTSYFNRSKTNSDAPHIGNPVSTITVMEISEV